VIPPTGRVDPLLLFEVRSQGLHKRGEAIAVRSKTLADAPKLNAA